MQRKKKSIFLSNINRNNRSSNGNKNINFRQINSSNYSIPKRNTLKQNKNKLYNFKEAQKTFYNNYTSSLNQKDQKKTPSETIHFCLNTIYFQKEKELFISRQKRTNKLLNEIIM